MTPRVFMHVKCRQASLLPGCTLTFKTLRTGFPTANVRVSVMPSADSSLYGRISDAARASGADVRFVCSDLQHDQWIETLVATEIHPFWIVDTDVVFFGNMEQIPMPGDPHLVGRLEPTWDCQATHSVHIERLHTCCLYINPSLMRERMRAKIMGHPTGPFHVELLGVRQLFVPRNGVMTFYDTLAGVYQAIGGQPFSEQENERFEHLHCGTWLHEAARDIAKQSPHLEQVHRAVYSDPSLAKGIWKLQRDWYERQRPN